MSDEQKILTWLDNTSDGAWVWDVPNSLIHATARWNDRFCPGATATRRTVAEWLGTLEQNDRPAVRAAVAGTADDLADCEARVVSAGSPIRIRRRSRVVERDGDGAPRRVIGCDTVIAAAVPIGAPAEPATPEPAEDVSGEAEMPPAPDLAPRVAELEAQVLSASEAIGAAQRQLASATKDAHDLLATLGHDMRAKVESILGMHALLVDTPLSAEQREYLEVIRHSSQSIVASAENVIDGARSEAGVTLPIAPHPFDLVACLDDCLDAVSGAAGLKDLEPFYRVDENVPRAVVADEARVRQVLLNLIGNAVKFTDKGTVEVRVEADAASDDRYELRFIVRDTGAGIPSERMERLFEPFAQVGDPAGTRSGCGLGLAISRRLAVALGGDVAVESDVERGSTFTFRVAVGRADSETVEKAPASDALRGRRIELLGDFGASSPRLLEWLQRWGCVVEGAGMGAAPAKGRPDLVMFAVGSGAGLADSDLAQLLAIGTPIVLVCAPGLALPSATRARLAGVIRRPLRPRSVQRLLVEAAGSLGPDAESISSPTSVRKIESGLPILVVEDNAVNQRVAKSLLIKLGYKPVVAANGREACDVIKQESFKLVLMDCWMPEMDGFEATRTIRRYESEGRTRVPIVALTSAISEAERERCRESGMDDFVAKPATLSDLQEVIERWVPVDTTDLAG
ncbi:MAG: ATP-binding protein [Vicinamibacterales bacterium]